jgi:hypothetical protein
MGEWGILSSGPFRKIKLPFHELFFFGLFIANNGFNWDIKDIKEVFLCTQQIILCYYISTLR